MQPSATFPRSGVSRVDAFLADGYLDVTGMSSRFAAGVCAHLMRRQSEAGIAGGFVEIGAFAGRFLIAMALGMPDDEPVIGIDPFTWPDDGLEGRFHANCRRAGLAEGRVDAWKTTTETMSVADLAARLKGQPARFVHIDGDHSPEPLMHDLELAAGVLHPKGLICLDDMLHPGYPFLVATVRDFLVAHPEWRVLAVLDREDIVAAPKFVLCRLDAVPLYENDLMESFAPFHFVLGGDALGHHCVVLTPSPRIADV